MKSVISVLFVVISFVISVPAQAVVQYSTIDLGTLGEDSSEAFGINASGQVVGWVNSHNYAHAFLYTGSTMTDLGTLGGTFSEARGINDSGQVVGISDLMAIRWTRFPL